jgi:Sortilin, neurotensin receptor 3,
VRARSLLILACSTSSALAQGNVWRHDSVVVNQSTNPLLDGFRFRSIGPASMGGRIDDIAVAASNPNIIYIGYATGGVFRSVNNGTTFEPVFETYGSASIGDIAIDPTNPNVVYVGTGEPNNRQTSSFGDGIYKSTDGGKTFTQVGLRETQTIGRIVIDPKHPETVYVAAPGHLFGAGPDRGVFKTTDGGRSWNKVKYVDENTGFTDIALDPSNPNVLYAASYQRRRSSCCFNGGGPGSALWKTEDGGKNWTRLSGSGLPGGTYGRIAVDVSQSNPNVVYAQIETDGGAEGAAAGAGFGGRGGYDWCNNGGPGRGFGGRGGAAGSDTTREPPKVDADRSGVYRSDNRGRSWTVVSNCNSRPLYFSQLRVDPSSNERIYVGGVRMSKSTDGGKTFATMDRGSGFDNETEDNHAFWIDPRNPDHLLRGSDAGLAVSWDQGETWEYVHIMATALAYWVSADMGHPYHVFAGFQDNDSWGGPSATRGRIGIRSQDWYHLSGGDGFQTAADPSQVGLVYSESQDGNVVRTDLRTGHQQTIRPVAPSAGRGGARGGGAGGGAVPEAGSCVDGRIIAAGGGGRGGGGGGGGRGGGQPNVVNAQPGDSYRFNWNTPLMLSPHNPHIVWLGGNRLFKSYDQGNTWVASADLTRQADRCSVDLMGVAGTKPQLSKNDGVSAFSTITAISESPVMPDVVWAGTDDGLLQVSRDGGASFTEVGAHLAGLPAGAVTGSSPYWISRIESSHFEAGGAYVALDGHRSDDLHPYVFVTHDYGNTFASVSGNLPEYGNVQVVREDPTNRDLLYAGTEFGLFVSLDAGKHWDKFMNGYPTVRTDDILVHPRDGDLIVASHGRSLWIADDITPLQQFTPAVASQDVVLFDIRPAIAYVFDYRGDVFTGGDKAFEGENPPKGAAIQYYLKAAAPGPAKVSVIDVRGRTLCTSDGPATPGIHRVQWTLIAPLTSGGGRGGRAGGGGGGAAAEPGAGAGRGGNAPDTGCAGSAGGRGGAGAVVAPGTYLVKLTVGGHDYTKTVEVLEDRWLNER